MNITEILLKLTNEKKIDWRNKSNWALGISIFFFLGSIFGVDKSTVNTLPVILGISIICAIAFVVFREADKMVKKEQLEKEQLEKEQLEKEQAKKEQLEKEQTKKEQLEKEQLEKEQAKKEHLEKERLKKEQAEKEKRQAGERLTNNIKLDYIQLINNINIRQNSYDAFKNVLKEINSRYEKQVGTEFIHKLIHNTTKDLFFEGNQLIHKILIDNMLVYLYSYRVNYSHGSRLNDKIKVCNTTAENQAVAITLRALYFEQHGQSKKGYTGISKDICKEFFSNSEYFNFISNDERVNLITNHFDRINGMGIYARESWFLPSSQSERYYMDSLCNAYLKACMKQNNISQELLSDSNNVFKLIYHTLKPNNTEINNIEEKHKRDEEYELNRKTEKQCKACIWYDRCKQRNERPNCSAFEPK